MHNVDIFVHNFQITTFKFVHIYQNLCYNVARSVLTRLDGAMNEGEKHIWDQMVEEGESDLWYGRFVKFMRLGAKRKIATVYKREKRGEKGSNIVHGSWYDAAKTWRWEERARAYSDYVREEEDRAIADEQNKVIRSGYALMHRRIRLLENLIDQLYSYTKDESKIWLAETKTTTTTYGEDKSTEIIIEKVTFNAPLFMLIDKYLNSTSAEMGERVKKKVAQEEGETEFEIELVGRSPDDNDDGD